MDADDNLDYLTETAEKHRSKLNENFFQHVTLIKDSLENERWPEQLRDRGSSNVPDTSDEKTTRFTDAILNELYLLLCTNDAKYADVREQGKVFSKGALTAIAGYIAGAFTIAQGVATGGVAFIALAVFRVGVEAFCRASTHRVSPSPTPSSPR